MPPVWFESTISGGERPQTYVLDCEAAEIGDLKRYSENQAFLKSYNFQHIRRNT